MERGAGKGADHEAKQESRLGVMGGEGAVNPSLENTAGAHAGGQKCEAEEQPLHTLRLGAKGLRSSCKQARSSCKEAAVKL